MPTVSKVSTAAKPPAKGETGKGGKVLGMPRRTAVIAGIALLGGVAFIVWRNHQAASSAAGTSSGTADTGSSAIPASDGIQGGGMQGATGTETLVIKIREMQGHKKKKPVSHKVHEPPPPRRRRRRSFPGGSPGGPPHRKTSGPPVRR